MARAFGIVTSPGGYIRVAGLQDYRPIAAFSFLGRYRVIDFPVSSLSNSGIERIQVYVNQNPRSLTEHLGSGRIYNINSKRGKLQLLFKLDSNLNPIYDTDIQTYLTNLSFISRMHQPYVIITPGHMVFREDYGKLLDDHIESGADITMLYHKVNNAREKYIRCSVLNLNRQKGLKSIETNYGTDDERNIFMDTYVMKKDLFIELINKGVQRSSAARLIDVIAAGKDELDIRGIQHMGYFAAIMDMKSYFDANMELLDLNTAFDLFENEWPIYTRTTDSCPVRYLPGSRVKRAMVANGCVIEGTVENSIIGRGVEIHKGAVVKDCMILGHSVIGEDVHLENQIVDKWATVANVKELISTPDNPGYVRRADTV